MPTVATKPSSFISTGLTVSQDLLHPSNALPHPAICERCRPREIIDTQLKIATGTRNQRAESAFHLITFHVGNHLKKVKALGGNAKGVINGRLILIT